MLVDSWYLTESVGLEKLCDITDLAPDEVESLVGRFRLTHYRFPGKLRGEVTVDSLGKVILRHHFTKKEIWASEAG